MSVTSRIGQFLSLLSLTILAPCVALAEDASLTNMHQKWGPLVRDRFVDIFVAGDDGGEWAGHDPVAIFGWYVDFLWPVLVFMVVAWFVARQVDVWGRSHFADWFNPNPANRAEKVSYLLFRFVMQNLSNVAFVIVCLMLIGLITGDEQPVAEIQSWLVFYFVSLRFAWTALRALLAPDAPAHRLVHLSDQGAAHLHRDTMITLIASSFFSFAFWMMHAGGLSLDSSLFFIIPAYLFTVVCWAIFALRNRILIGSLIAGMALNNAETSRHERGLYQVLGISWHIVFILYLGAAWVVTAARLMLGMASSEGLIIAPILILMGCLGIYGVALLVIDRISAQFGSYRARVIAESDIDLDDPEHYLAQERAWQGELGRLAEKAVSFLIFIAGIGILLEAWGVDVSSEESFVVRLVDIFIVTFMGYLIYQAVKLTLDRRIREETMDEQEAEPGDEGGGAGAASRLATLLPLFRNFLLITIAAISVMLVMTQMGVDIGPLFAGAGVVGVAVGFGAQTLIRDIFSGAFFLFDDAFRKGEYVDIEGTKGTVEKISIRSFQLRHHLGALHTIPFGEIKQLTNYSRDWAMMKLALRVTYDTDVEKVRKLIKVLGKELMAHPEVGDKFIQPLKSQGVLSMEDSAMILRVKFMTPPGEQFVVRKLVYAKIRELFKDHGIKFAHREVTVRVASDDGDAKSLTNEQKQQVAELAAGAAVDPTDMGSQGSPGEDR